MTIEKLDRNTKHITITLDIGETCDLTNLLYYARKGLEEQGKEFSAKEYVLNANMIMAHALLSGGNIPAFEREKIYELFDKAKEKESK